MLKKNKLNIFCCLLLCLLLFSGTKLFKKNIKIYKTYKSFGLIKNHKDEFVFNEEIISFLKSAIKDDKYSWMDFLIEDEFKNFKENGITREDVFFARKKKLQKYHPCYLPLKYHPSFGRKRYKVINSVIRGEEGPVKAMLSLLIKSIGHLPDLDFVYYEWDGIKEELPFNGPVLCGAKKCGISNVILFHDWYFNIGYPDTWGKWLPVSQEVDVISENISWENKYEKVFWRGTNGDGIYTVCNWKDKCRGKLCYLSQIYPEYIDAGFTGAHKIFSDSGFVKFLPSIKKEGASHEEHLRYKYQISLDGFSCTYPGFCWRLLSNCLVFKQDSDDITWYYNMLKPWVHYIPVKKDLSDLLEKLEWVIKNDDKAKKIAESSREFAKEHIMPKHIALYCYKVLLKYASLQKFKPSAKEYRNIKILI